MALQDGLAVAAIALSIVAMTISVLLYRWQTQQGERIGLVTIGTVRKMYHRIRYGEPDSLSEPEDLPDYLPSTSPRYIRPQGRVILTLRVLQPMGGTLRCMVEGHDGQEWRAERNQGVGHDLALTFPADFGVTGSLEPGMYDVTWYAVQRLHYPSGQVTEEALKVGEDWFGVLP